MSWPIMASIVYSRLLRIPESEGEGESRRFCRPREGLSLVLLASEATSSLGVYRCRSGWHMLKCFDYASTLMEMAVIHDCWNNASCDQKGARNLGSGVRTIVAQKHGWHSKHPCWRRPTNDLINRVKDRDLRSSPVVTHCLAEISISILHYVQSKSSCIGRVVSA